MKNVDFEVIYLIKKNCDFEVLQNQGLQSMFKPQFVSWSFVILEERMDIKDSLLHPPPIIFRKCCLCLKKIVEKFSDVYNEGPQLAIPVWTCIISLSEVLTTLSGRREVNANLHFMLILTFFEILILNCYKTDHHLSSSPSWVLSWISMKYPNFVSWRDHVVRKFKNLIFVLKY